MDLEGVRTFVTVVDAGRFQEAAVDLSITQQAVSKRIAALEKDLGVRLLTRSARGAQLTIDGQAFLPHARELLRAEERAVASVRPDQRALRVDVIGRRVCPAGLMRDFHRMHPDSDLDVVTHFDADTAIAHILSGAIDASFRAVTQPDRRLPDEIETARVFDEPLQLLVGSRHPLAGARSVSPAQLAGHRIWMPGNTAGTEWTAYYTALADEFGLTIDVIGPTFGLEPLLDTIADSAALATFVGAGIHLVWPADFDLRRVPVRDPTPVYPHSLVWHRDNAHPTLARLRNYLAANRPAHDFETWTPKWARENAN